MPTFADASMRNAQIHADIKNQRVVFSYPKTKNNEPSFHAVSLWATFTSLLSFGLAIGFALSGMYSLAFMLIAPGIILTAFFFFFTDITKTFYPKMNAMLARVLYGSYFYARFDSADAWNECTIPSFKNIFLHYEAYGDFSKYLIAIDVEPIIYLTRKSYQISWLDLGNDDETVYSWKAKFKFSKKPTKGFMAVTFL